MWPSKRADVQTSSPEEWYRVTNFIPFIDRFIIGLKTRFTDRIKRIIPFGCLIPADKDA